MAASVLTLYCNNPLQSNSSAGLLDLTQPAASLSTTGWVVGKKAASNYTRMSYNQELISGNFNTTAQPDGPPSTAASFATGGAANDCWRLSDATTGDFSTGTWYSSLSVIAVTAGGSQDGRARFRYWRSSSASGANATEITAGTMVGTTTTNLSTSVAQSSSASTRVVGFSLSNEYLFYQCAWEVTGAGGSNSADVLIRLGSLAPTTGSGLVTSLFSATGAAAAAARGTGYYTNYYKGQVGDLY